MFTKFICQTMLVSTLLFPLSQSVVFVKADTNISSLSNIQNTLDDSDNQLFEVHDNGNNSITIVEDEVITLIEFKEDGVYINGEFRTGYQSSLLPRTSFRVNPYAQNRWIHLRHTRSVYQRGAAGQLAGELAMTIAGVAKGAGGISAVISALKAINDYGMRNVTHFSVDIYMNPYYGQFKYVTNYYRDANYSQLELTKVSYSNW